MRKHHAFRPPPSEVLEARAVPSASGVAVPTGLPGISITLPAQVSTASPKVQAAFATFDQAYLRAVDDVLLAPGPDGLVVPIRNREAFDRAVEQSLDVLARQLVLSLGSGSGTGSTTPASSTANQVVSAVVGGGPNSLESQLLALPTTAIGFQLPPATAGPGGGPGAPSVPNVVSTAEQVRPPLRIPEAAEAEGSSGSGASTGSSTASPATPGAPEAIRSAFGAFLDDYFGAVRGVLLAPSEGGRVDPGASRADFDARVGQALRSLDARIAGTLGRDPSTASLGDRVRSAIEGDGSASLKASLAGLATPGAAQGAVVREFTLGSSRAIARALATIGDDVARALGPAAGR